MIKIKNPRRFKIFVIISVIVLILLVWCIIWINIVFGEKNNNIKIDNTQENIANIEQNIKKENIDDKIENTDKDENADKDIEKQQETVKTEEDLSTSQNETSYTKPMVVPENLPESEVYAVYNNTLIIGDSRTEGFKLYSGVKNASYFCMKAMTIDKIVEGKKVNIDGHTVSVYDLLDATSYDKIIIGVGLNELGWNHIETFLEDYGQLIDKIKEKQPDAAIYLQAVLPVSRSKNDSDRVHNNAQIYWYNENIIKLASDKGVQFVNPAAALVDEEGYLVVGATTDGVHLNSEYCKVWAKYLAELV